MTTPLRDEIRQTRPWSSLEQEAFLSLERTAAVLGHEMTEALRPHGVTPTQYNVLRILRGAGAEGLCRNQVRERMIAQVPDVTRLLDRLEAAGLIERARGATDRRFVTTRITAGGMELLSQLDGPVAEVHRRQLGHMGEERLRTLIELLGASRERPRAPGQQEDGG